MKPNFALTLSFDGIGLLHRVQGGWHLVGEVAHDAGDMTADLAELVAKARALDPTGLRTKLVIPDAQIRYMALGTAERDVGRIETMVREALDGATPYALKDLAWDWSVRSGTVHVAAVARETLAEAEAFAREHHFNPYAFVAMPSESAFAAEPFFGETGYAARVLGPDETVDREAEIIRVIGAEHLPEPSPVPPEAAPDPVAGGKPAAAPRQGVEPPSAAPAPDTAPPDTVPASPRADALPLPSQAGAAPAPKADTRAATVDAPQRPPEMARTEEKRARRDRRKSKAARDAPNGTKSPPVPVAFASSRNAGAALSADPGAQQTTPLPKARLTPPGAAASTTPASADAPAKPGQGGEEPAKPAAAPANGAFLSRRKTARKGAPIEPAKVPPAPSGGAVPASEPQPMASSGTLDEAQRMTVFGARRNGESASAQRPRHMALVLTALLLLVLVAVAAWAALTLDDGIAGLLRGEETVETAAQDPPAGAGRAPEAAPADAAGPPEPAASAITQPRPLPRAEAVPEELPADEVRARYAATGIWQMAPDPPEAPGTTTRRDVYRTGADAPVTFAALPDLPQAGALMPSALPSSQGTPPPPQARFDLDDRGLVKATPEGAQTPDGITVFAGAPPVTPPPTPPRAEAQVLDDPTAAAPETPGLRPRIRPASLDVPDEAAADAADAATETGEPGETGETNTPEPQDAIERALQEATQESSLRPKLRPARFAARVEQARAAAAEPVHADHRMSVPVPSAASVARAATDSNRISLRKVNLIGVYGSAGERRALVRLANGKYRKVKVGDPLDGGQVAAIGEDELHYVKRGRSVVLKMPKG